MARFRLLSQEAGAALLAAVLAGDGRSIVRGLDFSSTAHSEHGLSAKRTIGEDFSEACREGAALFGEELHEKNGSIPQSASGNSNTRFMRLFLPARSGERLNERFLSEHK